MTDLRDKVLLNSSNCQERCHRRKRLIEIRSRDPKESFFAERIPQASKEIFSGAC